MDFFFQTKVRLYFVMPYIQGRNLHDHVKIYKRFNEEIVKFYITNIVIGVGQLH